MYVYTYIRLYVRMYVCMHVSISASTPTLTALCPYPPILLSSYSRLYPSTYMYVCTEERGEKCSTLIKGLTFFEPACVYVCVCVCVCVCVRICTYTHTHTHTREARLTYTRMYTCIEALHVCQAGHKAL